jgi:hypothetical protein
MFQIPCWSDEKSGLCSNTTPIAMAEDQQKEPAGEQKTEVRGSLVATLASADPCPLRILVQAASPTSHRLNEK